MLEHMIRNFPNCTEAAMGSFCIFTSSDADVFMFTFLGLGKKEFSTPLLGLSVTRVCLFGICLCM